jgi:dihydroorotase (multifunctional complex type)
MIVNGRVVLPDSIEVADLLIDDGRISAIQRSTTTRHETATEVIDAVGSIVLPGLVDVHVHFRDPGYPQKENFASGSAAAAAGGVTTIVDMPNTDPPTTTPDRLADKMHRAQRECSVAFAFHGGPPRVEQPAGPVPPAAATHKGVDLIAAKEMQWAGIVSFKIYMPHHERDYIPLLAPLGLPLTIHAEEPALLSEPKDGSVDAFLKSRPAAAESGAIAELLQHLPEGSFHICHVSTAEGLTQILDARQRGVSVTCEVTPHHLLLTAKDLERIGPIAKSYPPLRGKSDADKLVNACLNGKIDLIASDHAPHADTEKGGRDANFATAPAGIIGVETALPLLHTYLVRKAGMPLSQLVQLMGVRPAQRFHLQNTQGVPKGRITVGADADLVLFNPKTSYTIRGEALHGKPKLTPFEGRKVTGSIRRTLLQGHTIFEEEP